LGPAMNNSPNPAQHELSPSVMDRMLAAEPAAFLLSADGHLKFNDVCVAALSPGAKPTEPQVRSLVEGARAAEHLRRVVHAKIASLLLPLSVGGKALGADNDSLLRSISEQLCESLGSVRLRQVQGLVRALQGPGKGALGDSRVVVGRRYVYVRENLTPEAVVARLALLAAYKKVPAPSHFKPAQVLLLDQKEGLPRLSAKDLERLGYELIAGRAVRVDIVERVLAPSFNQNSQNILPSLMHTFRCSEEEARAVVKQLNLGGPRAKRGPRPKEGDERRTRAGRNRSGGQKSAYRQS
jgi:hypothetical protein